VLALCAGLTAPAVDAGADGREWSFEVLEVQEVDARTHLILLRPAPRGEDFPRSCETFIIHSFYDLESWTSAGRALAKRSAHDRSIRHLAQAQAMNRIVRIAMAPQGFAMESETNPCEVTSRAFTVLPDPGGSAVIISFYEDPKADGPEHR